MELLINLAIITLVIIGGLYAIGLIIVALIGPPAHECEYDCTDDCNLYPLDLCSSECDDECAANEHYPGQDWRR
jgi:hypothetical protein